jgi:hypothetical protein
MYFGYSCACFCNPVAKMHSRYSKNAVKSMSWQFLFTLNVNEFFERMYGQSYCHGSILRPHSYKGGLRVRMVDQ